MRRNPRSIQSRILLSTTARAGCLQVWVGQDIPDMCLVTRLTATQVRCLYIMKAYFSIKSIFVLVVTKQRGE